MAEIVYEWAQCHIMFVRKVGGAAYRSSHNILRESHSGDILILRNLPLRMHAFIKFAALKLGSTPCIN